MTEREGQDSGVVADLPARFTAHVTASGLFPVPGRALVAVSGGPDSVALLELLVRTAPQWNLELVVGHVDHGIAPESGEWAARVRRVAADLQVPCRVTTLGLGPEASETRARRARYHALDAMGREAGTTYLVTGHHADDQVETVLFRLFRGTGMAGLAGIAASAPGGLVRPLLEFSKAELGAWLDAEGRSEVAHRDPANVDDRHHRSWIRGRLLPLLRERFGPELDPHLLDTARHARDDRRAWAAGLRTLPDLAFRCGDGEAEIAIAPLRDYDSALAEALVRAAAREAGCVIGPRRARRLWAGVRRAGSGRRFDLGGGWVAEVAFGLLRVLILKETLTAAEGIAVRWGEEPEGHVRWGRHELWWSRGPAGDAVRDASVIWVTPGAGELRGPRPGDRIRPLHGIGRRRVSRILMEGRVPRSDRGHFPLITRGDAVLWVPGLCRSATDLPAPGEPAIRLEVYAD